jgi:hypothetical protein
MCSAARFFPRCCPSGGRQQDDDEQLRGRRHEVADESWGGHVEEKHKPETSSTVATVLSPPSEWLDDHTRTLVGASCSDERPAR